jgi:hypothetical protein
MADAEGIIPTTEERAAVNTREEISRQIRRGLEARIYYYAQWPEQIDDRLDELDREWDVERLLETNAGIFSLAGLTFGSMHRRWFVLPALVGAFLLQHAIQGWCPPVSVLRRLGIRTRGEINHERFALKALRGDFDHVRMDGEPNPQERARRAIEAAEQYL